MKKTQDNKRVSAGMVVSLMAHAVLILYLLHMVHPTLLMPPQHKNLPTIVLEPPPPPPPPPPPKKPPPPPPKPPPPTPHAPPPPPQEIVTHAPVTTPDVPTVPPPPPPPPPQPPQPVRKVGTSVPQSYFDALQRTISNNVRYPAKSLRDEEEGTCKVLVTISRDGTIEDVKLKSKTGFVALDAECKNVFDRIVKFPAVPASVSPDITDFAIELPITFNLQ
jgi:protein TonB